MPQHTTRGRSWDSRDSWTNKYRTRSLRAVNGRYTHVSVMNQFRCHLCSVVAESVLLPVPPTSYESLRVRPFVRDRWHITYANATCTCNTPLRTPIHYPLCTPIQCLQPLHGLQPLQGMQPQQVVGVRAGVPHGVRSAIRSTKHSNWPEAMECKFHTPA